MVHSVDLQYFIMANSQSSIAQTSTNYKEAFSLYDKRGNGGWNDGVCVIRKSDITRVNVGDLGISDDRFQEGKLPGGDVSALDLSSALRAL